MKLAIDVYYPDQESAIVAGVLFNSWEDCEPEEIIRIKKVGYIAPYISGKFYQRELPPIKALLDELTDVVPKIDTYIIDGYVKLKGYDGSIWNGLGAVMYDELKNINPDLSVVGVAKTKFGLCSDICKQVLRGESTSPLWVSSIGKLGQDKAAECVYSMWGDYRIPHLLKLVDKETKK